MRFPIFTNMRLAFTFLALIAASSLIMAYGAEHFFGLHPCILCLYQRYVYMAFGAVAVGGMVFPNRWVMPIIGLIILVGGGIAFYQVGIEQGIFQLPPICKSLPLQGGSMQSMKDQLLQQPLVPCDKPAWDLFGISMAGYNGLFSLALLVYCWIAFRRGRP